MNSHPPLVVQPANVADIQIVSDILLEAAAWLRDRGSPMWRDHELAPLTITRDVEAGLFFVGTINDEPAGVIKFQLEDNLFWPDVPVGESAFVHRLAVKRRFAGGAISSALLTWAAARAGNLKRQYLRLDCEASRPRLRAFYERFGFRHHSDRLVPPYFVSRYEYQLV
jgi:GNAT superfamily N-acetyltransferase